MNLVYTVNKQNTLSTLYTLHTLITLYTLSQQLTVRGLDITRNRPLSPQLTVTDMPRTPESPHNKADSGRRIWDLEQPDLEPVTLTPVSSELKLSSLQNLQNNEAGWAGISREKAGELGIVEIHTRGRSIFFSFGFFIHSVW